LYCFLAEAYLAPPGEELLARAKDRHLWEAVGMALGEAPVAGLRAFAACEHKAPEDGLEAAFGEILSTKKPASLTPHELSPLRGSLPEQLGEDMDFMRYLCSQEVEARAEGERELEAEIQRVRRAFVLDHLSRWVDDASREIERVDRSGLYNGIATLTRGMVALELASAAVAAA